MNATTVTSPPAEPVAPIVDVEDLTTAFGTHVVHEHLNMEVRPHEILALVGGSGSGKTTLLRQILGLDTPKSGVVKVFGRPVHGGRAFMRSAGWQGAPLRRARRTPQGFS